MAKVYVLTINSVSDYSGSEEIKAYSTKKKAQGVMREKYNAEKSDMVSVYGKDNTAYYIDNNSANVHLSGRSVEGHIDFKITECEIE